MIVSYLCCVGSQLQHKVQFVWVNQEDDAEVGLIYGFTVCYLSNFIFCFCLRSRSFPYGSDGFDTDCYLFRKQPCLMLGTRFCRFCTWWQCYCYHRQTYCFFHEHLLMVISQKYQKVGILFTAKLYAASNLVV